MTELRYQRAPSNKSAWGATPFETFTVLPEGSLVKVHRDDGDDYRGSWTRGLGLSGPSRRCLAWTNPCLGLAATAGCSDNSDEA